eukprot:5996645-Alexandrium_andersonii.AAC.1
MLRDFEEAGFPSGTISVLRSILDSPGARVRMNGLHPVTPPLRAVPQHNHGQGGQGCPQCQAFGSHPPFSFPDIEYADGM